MNLVSEAEKLSAMTKFEQREYAKSLGFKLNDVLFPEVASCMNKSEWDQGSGLSRNKDMHASEAFDESHTFVMPIVLRMIGNDKG